MPKTHEVKFLATKVINKQAPIVFAKKNGEVVAFEGHKPTKVKVLVDFEAKNKKK